jgi:hypothetical protein
MSSPARAFETVAYEDARGGQRTLSADEYAALPLSERIRCVLDGRARFVAADGSEVGSRAALAWLRERSPAAAAS